MIDSVHVDTARTWRGGQNQVLLTVTGLAAQGHRALLVAHADGELKRRAEEGLRLVSFSPRSEFDLQSAWQLGRVLAEVEPRVVHAHDPMAVALTATALSMPGRAARRPLVVASRRVDFHLRRNAFSRWKHRQVDVFVAASRSVAAILATDGVTADRIVTVHDGVNIGYLDKQPAVDAHAAFGLPHGAPVVGNVAALVAHKGQRHLVAAAARVVRQMPDARFLILGEGELHAPLERQIRDLGLDRHVKLTGFRADAAALTQSFDIFAMSSVTEGLGSAMLDAMAYGRAIVGTRAGGIPEAVEHGTHGLLVPPHDEPALADAIIKLLGDPDERRRLGAAARQRIVDEFSVERMVAAILRVYEERLAAR